MLFLPSTTSRPPLNSTVQFGCAPTGTGSRQPHDSGITVPQRGRTAMIYTHKFNCSLLGVGSSGHCIEIQTGGCRTRKPLLRFMQHQGLDNYSSNPPGGSQNHLKINSKYRKPHGPMTLIAICPQRKIVAANTEKHRSTG